jgi:DNA-binding LacI/PurR family transcriptional regulator
MGATQVDIAREVGLDVSSVNKILNQKAGPKFKKATVKKVLSAAKRLGYNFSRASKGRVTQLLAKHFPKDVKSETLAIARGVSVTEVLEIKSTIYRGLPYLIVLLMLRGIVTGF